VPGAFTSGTNHFVNAGSPDDKARLAEYESGPTAELADQIMKGFGLTAPPQADVPEVAEAIVKVVDICPSAHALSGSTSILPRTGPRSLMALPTVSAPSCSGTWDLLIFSDRREELPAGQPVKSYAQPNDEVDDRQSRTGRCLGRRGVRARRLRIEKHRFRHE
jgi:hypothetical protein